MFGTKLLKDEIIRLTAENARKDSVILELIDKFIHNRQPERFTAKVDAKVAIDTFDDGMGDPVSIAEREAWEQSRPKTPEYLQGTSGIHGIMDEG